MRTLGSMVALVAVVAAGCGGGSEAREEVGTLVGFKASMDLADASAGAVDDMEFGGVLVLELDDGSEVEAVAPPEIVDGELTGGDRYRIELDEETEVWTVVEQVD